MNSMADDIILEHANRIEDLIGELNQYLLLKKNTLTEFQDLFKRYQKRKVDYQTYHKRIDVLFEGKGKTTWVQETNGYLQELMYKISFFNKQIFFRVFAEGNTTPTFVHQATPTPQKNKPEQRVTPLPRNSGPKKAVTAKKKSIGGTDLEELFDELESA